jgi:hypothetical protein
MARQGTARFGKAAKASQGMSLRVMVWQGRLGSASLGEARSVPVWQGSRVKAWNVRPSPARTSRGKARQGSQGMNVSCSSRGLARLPWHGTGKAEFGSRGWARAG